MKKIYSIIGVFWASISIVLLIREGVELGPLNGPFALIIDFFEAAMYFLFAPIVPYASSLGVWLYSWFGYDVELHKYWKYIYTLILLYSGAQASHAWQAQFKALAIYRIIAGTLVGFIGAAIIGTAPLQLKFAITFVPVSVGLVFSIYQLFNSFWVGVVWRKKDLNVIWPEFRFDMKYPIYYIVIGILSSISNFIIHTKAPIDFGKNLVALALIQYTILLILFWFALGLYHTAKDRIDKPFFKKLKGQGSIALALLMFQSILGASLFLIANAGWLLVENM